MKQNNLFKFIITGGIIILALAVGGFYYWSEFIIQKNVTLNPSTGMTITLGTPDGDMPSIKKELIKTTTKITKRIPTGVYLVIFSSQDKLTEIKTVNLTEDTTIETPQLQYSTARLDKTLDTDRLNIHSVAYRYASNDDYKITSEQLLGSADWYVAKLTPNNSNRDTLKIILHKVNNSWIVAAKPAIALWVDDYQAIPQDIIRAANKLGFY